jgi:hypothetical protein
VSTPNTAAATGGFLTTIDELDFWFSAYGVPVDWVGEDGDAVALTADWRHGAAAIHRLARYSLSCPARAHSVEVTHARFRRNWSEGPDYPSWTVSRCEPDDPGAMPVVWAREVIDYDPDPAHPLCEAVLGDPTDYAADVGPICGFEALPGSRWCATHQHTDPDTPPVL